MFKLEDSKQDDFMFEFEGKTYSIPSRNSLPLSTFKAMRKAINAAKDPEEAVFDEVMKLFDEYAPEVTKKITLAQAMELFKAYANDETDDEASLGES